MHLTYGDIIKGVFGTATTITGFTISLQEFEIWLRIISLLVGITVGVLTAIGLYRKLKTK